MAYGFEIVNDSGNVIVDTLYKNFSYYENGSLTISGDPAFDGRVVVNFSTPVSTPPLIAIKPSSTVTFVSVIGYVYNSETFKYTGFTAYSSGFTSMYNPPANTSFYWRAYIPTPNNISSNYGLVTYNSSGEVVFDSSREYFKIHSVTTDISISDPVNIYGGGTQTITHSNISDPYYLLTPYRFAGSEFDGPISKIRVSYITGIKRVNSTSVMIGWDHFKRVGSTGIWSSPFSQNIFVLS